MKRTLVLPLTVNVTLTLLLVYNYLLSSDDRSNLQVRDVTPQYGLTSMFVTSLTFPYSHSNRFQYKFGGYPSVLDHGIPYKYFICLCVCVCVCVCVYVSICLPTICPNLHVRDVTHLSCLYM